MRGTCQSNQVQRIDSCKFLHAPGGGEFYFQTFDDHALRKDRGLVRQLHGMIDQHFTALEKLNARGAGIFATINRTDGKGRKRENIVGIRAVFVDLDVHHPRPSYSGRCRQISWSKARQTDTMHIGLSIMRSH